MLAAAGFTLIATRCIYYFILFFHFVKSFLHTASKGKMITAPLCKLGYEAPIPKNVAACRQKSQDAEVKVCYDVRRKEGKLSITSPQLAHSSPQLVT